MIEVKPCRVTSLTAGVFSESIPLTYNIRQPEIELTFTEFSVEPADCQVDGSDLKVIYTPFTQGMAVDSTSVADAISRSVNDDDSSQASHSTY